MERASQVSFSFFFMCDLKYTVHLKPPKIDVSPFGHPLWPTYVGENFGQAILDKIVMLGKHTLGEHIGNIIGNMHEH
jgi:hypothetical protein